MPGKRKKSAPTGPSPEQVAAVRSELPEAEAPDFESSLLDVPGEDGRVFVVDGDGRVQSLDRANLGSAGNAGMRPATLEDLDREADQRQYGEGVGAASRAAAEGVARGLTVGLSDPMMGALGVDTKGLQLRKELNPVSATVGEVAGAIAPAFATGGESLLARGLAASPAGLAARAGMAVERGAASAIGRSALGRAGAAALGGAAEGAIQGVGTAISEAELREDVDLTGELLLSHVGMSSLLGGAGAGALRLGGEAVGKLGETGADAFRRAFGEGKDTLAKVGSKRASVDVVEDAARAAGAADSGVSGAAPGVEIAGAAPVVKPSGAAPDGLTVSGRIVSDADAAAHLDDTLQGATRDITDEGSALLKQLDEHEQVVNQSLKPQNIRKHMKKAAPASMDDAVNEASRLHSGLREEIDGLLEYPSGLEPKELGALRRLSKKLDDFGAKVKDPDQADVMYALDGLKQDVGDVAKAFRGRAGAVEGSDVAYSVGDRMRRQYEQFRTSLEDASVWGEGAAGYQKRWNQAWVRDLDSNDLFRSAFTSKAMGRSANHWDELRRIDAEKIGPLMSKVGRAEGEFDEKLFKEWIEARVRRAEIHAQESGGKKGIKQAQELRAQANKILSRFDDARTAVIGARRHADRAGTASLITGTIGGLGGFLVGGPLGAAAGAAGGSALGKRALDMVQSATKLTRLQDAADSVMKRVSAGVKRGLEVGGKAGRAARSAAASEASERLVRKGESHAEEYDRRRKPVEEWAANPATAVARTSRHMEAFQDVAPGVAASFAAGANRAASYLASQMPKQRVSSDRLRPDLDDTGRVSERERARWLRLARAVEAGPEGILRSFEKGDLSREQADVLKNVWPKLHARIVQQVAHHAADAKEPLPYRKLVNLSLLLGVPLHSSLDPQLVSRMQATYSEQQSQQTPDQQAPSGSKPTNLAKGQTTHSEMISQR